MNQVVENRLRTARRATIAVIGGTVLLAGIALIVLPGPAMVVIPIGLAILGTEFVWARRLLRKVKKKAGDAAEALTYSSRTPDKKHRGSGEP